MPKVICSKKSHYDMGIRDGLFERYSAGKLQSSEQWQQGQRHGESRRYHSNGQLRSLDEYVEGKLTGKSESYFEDGTVNERGKRINGQWVGQYESFYDNGKPRELAHYASKKKENASRYPLDGHFARWYANGDPNEEGEYQNGNKQGLWIQYSEGQKQREQTFADGKTQW